MKETNLRTVTYNQLPKEAKEIRTIVFINEQGFVDEFDKTDHEATHLVLFDEDKPIACCRYFPAEQEKEYFFGRLAVIKEYRGQRIGAQMIAEAEKSIGGIGGTKVWLHAQCRAQNFYEKQGYLPHGEIGEEEGCPHIWMYKELGK